MHLHCFLTRSGWSHRPARAVVHTWELINLRFVSDDKGAGLHKVLFSFVLGGGGTCRCHDAVDINPSSLLFLREILIYSRYARGTRAIFHQKCTEQKQGDRTVSQRRRRKRRCNGDALQRWRSHQCHCHGAMQDRSLQMRGSARTNFMSDS